MTAAALLAQNPVDRERAALWLAYAGHSGCHCLLGHLGRRFPEEIWNARHDTLLEWGMNDEAVRRFEHVRQTLTPERLEEALAVAEMRFLAYGTRGYPEQLADLAHPPAGLFVKGKPEAVQTLLHSPRVTIVGTRRATAYGTRAAREFAVAFATRGIAVISGMALGIDGRAHEAALEVGGLTAAVLGCGADVVYPRRHRGLYQAISEHGLILSELPPGTMPSRWTFPNRNRLLGALGDAVIVVEGPPTSGAMQTAEHAIALGRPVFAVPGSIFMDNQRGCHFLLRDGAVPAVEPGATVEEFLVQTRIERGDRQTPDRQDLAERSAPGTDPFRELAATGREAILEALAERACSIDILVSRTGIPARRLTAALAELELAGLAARDGPGLYIRAP
jgi:DNA processing protein